jgi:hypothetical protein
MIKLIADKVIIQGPQMDGGYKIIFYVGEQEQPNVIQLMAVPQQTLMNIQIEAKTEDSWQTKATA